MNSIQINVIQSRASASFILPQYWRPEFFLSTGRRKSVSENVDISYDGEGRERQGNSLFPKIGQKFHVLYYITH